MLESCPQCGYSLRGLPADHRCPECGLTYDAESEVYRHAQPRLVLAEMVGLFGCAIAVVNAIRGLGRGPAALQFSSLAFAAVASAAAAWMFSRIWRNYRKGPLVAVLPDGLYVRLEREETIPWQNITLITGDDPKRGLVVYCGKRLAPYVGISGVFRTRADVQRFVGQVRARRSRPSSWDPLAGSSLSEVPADPP